MIGNLSYNDMLKLANELEKSSNNIKSLISEKQNNNINNIKKFCEELDSYIRFLTSSIQLYKDSDDALKLMIEKNK